MPASNFAAEARGEVAFDLLEEGMEVIDRSVGRRGDRPLTPGGLREAARVERWDGMDQASLFFRLAPGEGEVSVAGEADSAQAGWAVREAREYSRRNPDDDDVRTLFAPGGSSVLVHQLSYEGRGGLRAPGNDPVAQGVRSRVRTRVSRRAPPAGGLLRRAPQRGHLRGAGPGSLRKRRLRIVRRTVLGNPGTARAGRESRRNGAGTRGCARRRSISW